MVKGAISDIGKIRDKNQDAYYISSGNDLELYIVADGMGGHRCGEIASSMALDIVKEQFLDFNKKINSKDDILKFIKHSIEEANIKIYLKSLEMKECQGMGTTMTLAYIFKDNILLGHVGDSRAYIIEKEDIRQVTEDHSYINELLKNGTITLEEARTHPKKNMITRAVGSSSKLEVDVIEEKYEVGDILLLCSDGLFNMLDEEDIKEVFNREKSMQNACEILTTMANEKGGLDNITIVAIKFDEVKL